jgi:hypothetical protein
VLLIKHTRSRRTKGLPISKQGALPPDPDNLKFHVRVLIPCYKESTDLVKETVLGALKAALPKDTLRTVYLCDDGKDPTKAAMVHELNKEWGCLEYVSGRTRDPNGARGIGCSTCTSLSKGTTAKAQCNLCCAQYTALQLWLLQSTVHQSICHCYCAPTGETNGKSNNLNHCLTKVIYKDYFPVNPQGPKIPKTEVRCSDSFISSQHCMISFDAVAAQQYSTISATQNSTAAAGVEEQPWGARGNNSCATVCKVLR